MRNPAARYDLQPSGTTTVERALDALNFFLADVRDGLGPYLAIYLLTERKWDEASIGSVMSIAAIAGILAQTPAGALIDRSRAKRALMIAAAIAVTAACLLLPLLDRFELVAATQALAAASGSVLAPAIAAVTLGIVGPKAFAARTGRNEAFNHAGNAVAAAIAGGTAYWFGPVVVFWLLAAMALASIAATLSIPPAAIDHQVARGLDDMEEHGASQDRPSGFRVLLTCRPLLIFAVSTVIFHFANAAMLPLVGQKLALVNRNLGTSLMSVCIIAAQIVMVPVAMLVGRKADVWGRKPIFATALAVLAIRGALYPLSDNPYWLVSVQLLDGIGAGIFGALFPLVIADLTHGTGHFNISQGAIATATGLGGALSTAVAGFIIVHAGYSAAFLFLAAVACAGLIGYCALMPETLRAATTTSRTTALASLNE
ncbi:MFS family permease [Bradyrhizobium elkanii]|jgi:MFS family permease|uniref:MFS transporter n=1 Tax=unclassified Bradyrhizobium TaxID=2631580 RepID=UPI0004B8F63E|nr:MULTISPECIES: MFS transporter [Bradyrhizobium]MCS3453145.1 MFS family permease [Bradyrhizobium elkanii]MCS3564748.1 MFS family permease [Bradyrhizobium elkanii]MCW2145421.1 MFS family permease [Bradyrhizobium elkanii]MCW2355761.1 MFS family permease [Bradyrhizobium elkanii]MCW2378248.1 MFS family permease [Bradyrhizobium elkanii]